MTTLSFSRTASFASIALLALACHEGADLDDLELGEVEPEACFGPCEPAPGGGVYVPPAPSDPDLTYVTFYSGPNQTGSWWTVSGKTVTDQPQIQMFDYTTLQSWGLYQNVGSVRIQCGTRAGTVSLFSIANPPGGYEAWSGSGAWVACEPGQVHTIDDIASLTDLQGLSLAGRVRSAVFYAHAASHRPFALDFDGNVLQQWNNSIDAELPDGAETNGDATMKMVGWAGFEIRQNLYLDHAACTERAGHFTLRGGPKVDVNGNLYWQISVRETYVSSGFGDSWGCRSGMKSKLNAGAATAAQTLTEKLEAIPSGVVPTDGDAYYFAPRNGFTKFDLHVAM